MRFQPTWQDPFPPPLEADVARRYFCFHLSPRALLDCNLVGPYVPLAYRDVMIVAILIWYEIRISVEYVVATCQIPQQSENNGFRSESN